MKTRLAATLGETEAARIYRWLAERQLTALPRSWPTNVHFDPPDAHDEMVRWLGRLRRGLRFTPQCHGDLGARLAGAFATEFAQGADRVIAIGGDCPELGGVILQSARRALETNDAVLGPAADGGYYLIGLKAPCAALFDGITWSTPTVRAETKARLRANLLSYAELPVLEDVDDAASWVRVQAGGQLSA